MKKIVPLAAQSIAAESGSSYPEPFITRIGAASWHPMGEPFGLTQFGVNLEILNPGDQSALRHWHTLGDEFVYVIAGEVILVTDEGEASLGVGMCVGFKAGERNGHHFINRSAAQAQLIVMGARIPGDTAFYPDDDLAWFHTEQGRIAVHKDGTPYR